MDESTISKGSLAWCICMLSQFLVALYGSWFSMWCLKVWMFWSEDLRWKKKSENEILPGQQEGIRALFILLSPFLPSGKSMVLTQQSLFLGVSTTFRTILAVSCTFLPFLASSLRFYCLFSSRFRRFPIDSWDFQRNLLPSRRFQVISRTFWFDLGGFRWFSV